MITPSLLLACSVALTSSEEVAVDAAIATIKSVGAEGKGNVEAGKAWQILAGQGAGQIVPILSSLNDAGPLASNYLRSAVDAIAENVRRDQEKLPATALEQFVEQVANNGRARRMAFELLIEADPTARERWTPNLLLDPSPELRRDAVAYWTEQANQAKQADDKDKALTLYKKALSGAVDQDQVQTIAKAMEELGSPVNLPEHFGLIQNWKLVGPFDNKDEKGFYVAYPPESGVDFNASYDALDGSVTWKDHTTGDSMGVVDLNKAVDNRQGVLIYAATTFTVPKDRKLQIRFGTPNGWKLWVNGELVFARDEYHSGNNFDQYSFDVDM